eukprot:1018578-Pleurochrysis_carterae.AAC.4
MHPGVLLALHICRSSACAATCVVRPIACASVRSSPGRPAVAAGAREESRTACRLRWSFKWCSTARRCRPSVALISTRG